MVVVDKAFSKEDIVAPFFEFDFSGWRLRNLVMIQEAIGKGDLLELATMISGTVKSWEYAGDPKDVESLLDLDFNQWREVSKAFNQAMSDSFRT